MNTAAPTPSNTAAVAPASKIAVALRGVSIGYNGVPVVKDIDLEIFAGEILFIGGGSGCGKTTLLSSLNTLRPPISGSIKIDGIEIVGADDETLQSVRRRFGMMYQLGALFGGMTLLDNVRLPLEEFTDLDRASMDEVARAKLGLVGLGEHALKQP